MIQNIVFSFDAFSREAKSLFAQNESSVHRIVNIRETYDKLNLLSAKQDDLLRQALRCIEVEAYRAAHVMAWAALIDSLQEKLAADDFVGLNAAMPNWSVKDIVDLRERFTEFAIIDCCKTMKLLSKTQWRAMQGLLSRRNECAHPSDYFPDLNQSLGYVSEIIARFEGIA